LSIGSLSPTLREARQREPAAPENSTKAQAIGCWVCTALIALGAAVAHAASDNEASHILTVVILAAILLASWALRPSSRRLG